MTTNTWPCGTPRSNDNAFTGAGLPERKKARPINCKRGKPLDLTSIAHQSIAAPSDPVAKRAKLLRGSMR